MISKCKYKDYTKQINTLRGFINQFSGPSKRPSYWNLGKSNEQIPKLKELYDPKGIAELARTIDDAILESTIDLLD